MSRPNLFFIAGLSVYTLAVRLMPYALNHFGVSIHPNDTFYPWNFSPMSACCLFGAAYLSRTAWAYLLPVAILFVGDLGIWLLTGDRSMAFHNNMPFVYGSFLLIAFLGMWLREKRSLPRLWLTGLAGETCFFLITNFGVWYFANPATSRPPFDYTRDALGLLKCYTMGLPYFGNSLASTLFFSTVIFSPFLYQQRKAALATQESPTLAA